MSQVPAKTRLKAIVAMASNRVIGRNGALPWRLPEDLRWFKKLTLGHPVVMGRKTMESLGRPLPKRRNIVLSRGLEQAPPGFEIFRGSGELLASLASEPVVFVIGGAEVFRLLFPQCEELYLSFIYEPHEGDTFLPEFEDRFELAEVLHRDEDFELRHYIVPCAAGKRNE